MPNHSLIIGRTGTGKSTLAEIIIREATKIDRQSIILDPLLDTRWKKVGAVLVTADQGEFLHYAKTHTNLYLFVDEGGSSIGRYNPAMEFVTTTSRHLGHVAFIISHRLTQLPIVLRNNASKIYLFASTKSDKQIVAEEWDSETIMDTQAKLQPGEFIEVSAFTPPRRGKIDFVKKSLTWIR